MSATTAWQTAYISTTLADVNVDGYVDVGLSDVSSSIPGALDQVVYSSAQLLDDLPKGLTNITTSFQSFYDEFMAWVDDPSYYEDNKIWVEGPGRWDYEVVCDWFSWGINFPEYECWLEWEWVDGPEFWSYAHFNQDGYRLAKAIAKILSGDPDASVWKAVDILEQVFGVDIGGWNFDIPLPGIDPDVHVGYSLILAIASTEDIRTNQTPTCITSDYHNRRFADFLVSSSFNSRINDYLETRDVLNWEGVVSAYNEGLMLLDNDKWTDNRYAFVDGFGWFDARHATLGFGIGFNYGEHSIKRFESIWESLQEGGILGGGCTSAFIREDIYSNHVGARAGAAYRNDRSNTPAEHMRSEINAALLNQTTARAVLIAEGAL